MIDDDDDDDVLLVYVCVCLTSEVYMYWLSVTHVWKRNETIGNSAQQVRKSNNNLLVRCVVREFFIQDFFRI